MKDFLKKMEPYLWLSPAFLFFAVFTFYPFAKTIIDSFYIVDRLGNVQQFVGLENYQIILSDPNFVKSIGNTLLFVLLTVPISKVLGLMLALLANKKRKTSVFYEASFAVPMAMISLAIIQILRHPYTYKILKK